MLAQLDEVTQEIYLKYRPTLRAIGVDTAREDVQAAILNCHQGMEGVFQRVIEYWFYLQQRQQKLDYPSALLVQALTEVWTPRNWHKSYLSDPKLKSPCQIWWEEAATQWGAELRNELVADVSDRSGEEIILLRSGVKISLKIAKLRGWNWVLEYAQEVSDVSSMEQVLGDRGNRGQGR